MVFRRGWWAWCVVAALLAGGGALACNDPLGLPAATSSNIVDTFTLAALSGTPITQASAFDIARNRLVHTEQVADFDFAFDLSSTGTGVLFPALALRLAITGTPGLQKMTVPFDSVKSAPSNGYVDSSAVSITIGDVLVGRSRLTSIGCGLTGSLPRYAKFLVLDIDPQARSLRLKALVDSNCGYRSLQPGIPTS